MTKAPELGQRHRINWRHVNTVFSAGILIGAEVFAAAYAAGWAVANLLGLEDLGAHILRALFFIGGVAVILSFVRQARRVEPFTKTN